MTWTLAITPPRLCQESPVSEPAEYQVHLSWAVHGKALSVSLRIVSPGRVGLGWPMLKYVSFVTWSSSSGRAELGPGKPGQENREWWVSHSVPQC